MRKSFLSSDKKIFIIFIVALSAMLNCAFSQEQLITYNHYYPTRILKDQKPNHYAKNMKSLQGSKKYSAALASALLLKKYGKKRHLKKADKFLTENFEDNIAAATQSIAELEKQTQNFENEMSAQKATQLVAKYKDMLTLKEIADGHGGKYRIKDYATSTTKAETRKEDYFKKTAQFYLDAVIAARSQASSKAAYRLLAHKLNRALKYNKRTDISSLYKEIRPLATTSLGIGKVSDQLSNSGISISVVRDELYKDISNSIEFNRNDRNPMPPLPFFELIPNDKSTTSEGADLLVELIITKVNIEKLIDEPSSNELSKTEGEEENKKTYTATLTTHSKRARVALEGIYTIKDRKTGKVVRNNTVTGEYAWIEYWYTYTGNSKALSKGDKRRVTLKASPYPPRQELIRSGATYDASCLAGRVAKKANEYIRTIGK